MSSSKLGTIYLGKRGAAESHLLIVKQLLFSGVDLKVAISSKNQKLQEYRELDTKLFVLNLPTSVREMAEFVFKKQSVTGLVEFFRGCKWVYFYLPHPWDNFIARSLLKENIKVLRSIHDSKRHPGDRWPTRKSMVRQIRFSSEVITHSFFVAQRIGLQSQPIVIPLPVPKRRLGNSSSIKTVLFIGRFRAYKGIKELMKAWPKVLDAFPAAELVLAGEGKIKKGLAMPNVRIINRWLSPHEIENLIDSSTCVVFPYKEASQSGPLSLAISAFKPVVVTNVGGLMEQVANACHYEVEFNSDSIAIGIIGALAMDVQYESETKENRDLADYLIEKSKS
jgi:glycosyltransferase involved in cell wall biosynthesis